MWLRRVIEDARLPRATTVAPARVARRPPARGEQETAPGFGIDCVEGKARLARARDTGDGDDLPVWQTLREELNPLGIEIVTIALDTGGADAVRCVRRAHRDVAGRRRVRAGPQDASRHDGLQGCGDG